MENLVNRFSAFLVLVCSTACLAQTPQITSGAAVYIEAMGGYETYLAAAIVKKHVPLTVVADESKADYIIRSHIRHATPSQPAVVVNNTNVNNGGSDAWDSAMQRADARRAARGTTSASISVIDAQSSQIVFAYSVGKGRNTNQTQSAAEACAKHLKEFIEKPGK
jgi:hypothetical protein